jgi:hypothetical protein
MPNMNKMHLQHWTRNIRTKRPALLSHGWSAGPHPTVTADRMITTDVTGPALTENLEKFWNMSLKTGPMQFTPFPEDSGIFGRFVSLGDRWLQTFRNIVMPPSPRCFDLTIEDEDTAIFETSGTTHPRTSRRSHSRRLIAQQHRSERESLHRQ